MNTLKQNLLATGCFYDCAEIDAYIELISSNLETQHRKFKTQQHHIIPRCYFDYNNLTCDDSSSNIVNLFFKDHLMAHYYLFYCCSDGNLRHALASAFLLLKNTTCKDIIIDDVDLDNLQLMFEEYLKTRSMLYTGRKGCNKGRKTINNGAQEKLVFPEDLDAFLENGWTLGRLPFSEEDLLKKSAAHKNRKTMNNGVKTVHVKPQDVQMYLDKGFVFGCTSEFKETMKRVAANNPVPKGTYTVVFDGDNYKRIKTTELSIYIDQRVHTPRDACER